MKAYILGIAGILLISAVVTVICPSGKMGTFVKGTVRLFVLVVMLSPLIGWFCGEAPSLGEESTIAEDAAYLEACAGMLEERDRKDVEQFVSLEYGLSCSASCDRLAESGFPRVKIKILLPKTGIFEGEERIHILTDIREAVEARYGCAAEVAYAS